MDPWLDFSIYFVAYIACVWIYYRPHAPESESEQILYERDTEKKHSANIVEMIVKCNK